MAPGNWYLPSKHSWKSAAILEISKEGIDLDVT